jgi:hypothetical protein
MQRTVLLGLACEFCLLFALTCRSLTFWVRDSLAVCGICYVLWIQVLPRVRGYTIRQTTEKFDGGAQANKLVRVPNDQLAEWDATYDEHGNPLNRDT